MQPTSTPPGPHADDAAVDTRGDIDVLADIETQAAILVRHFEMLRRRSDVYAQLDRAEYLLLRTLEGGGPTDICGLAAALGLDPSTAGRQVTAMQAHGLVRRAPSSTDRRRSIVEPTEHGRRLMDQVRDRRRRMTADLLSGWTGEDMQTLAAMFTRYNQTVAGRYLS